MMTFRSAALAFAAAAPFCIGALDIAEAAPAALPASSSPYARWTNGIPADPNYFPIAVWLQNPRNAARYRAAGINLYVGLWRGPTPEQLAELKAAGVSLICGQNEAALSAADASVIVGWMHGDEPDNAQSLGRGKGYGPPIKPERIIADYERIRAKDPSRPVLLNLGQGVAWDNYIGRGVRRNHPEDYPEYLKGCDLASFDIYPVVHDSPEVAGKLEFVAHGVERLARWTDKPVWNCIECTRISNPNAKATPDQIRSEVWMSLIHGSRGLIYFVHQFKPVFNEAALLDDSENLAAVTALNRQIIELAPVLNSPNIQDGAVIKVLPEAGRTEAGSIAELQKRHGNQLYVFTVNMANQPQRARVTLLNKRSRAARVSVIGEEREIELMKGEFTDGFKPYAVHLYSLAE